MSPALAIIVGVVFLIGVSLLVGVVLVGLWLRRTQRTGALRTYLGAVICGAFACVACLATFLLFVAVRMNEQHPSGDLRVDPEGTLLLLGLGSLTFGAALACVLFSAWTIWRVVDAKPVAERAPPAHASSVTSA